MIIHVRLFATLRRPREEGGYVDRLTVELDEGATVASLLESIEVGVAPSSLMVMICRHQVGPEHALHDGEEVRVFPPISGGMTKGLSDKQWT